MSPLDADLSCDVPTAPREMNMWPTGMGHASNAEVENHEAIEGRFNSLLKKLGFGLWRSGGSAWVIVFHGGPSPLGLDAQALMPLGTHASFEALWSACRQWARDQALADEMSRWLTSRSEASASDARAIKAWRSEQPVRLPRHLQDALDEHLLYGVSPPTHWRAWALRRMQATASAMG